MKRTTFACILFCGLLAACGGRPESDLDRSSDDIRKEAAGMDVAELEAVIKEYENWMKAKGEEIEQVAKDQGVAAAMEEAKEMTDAVAKAAANMQIYAMELAKKK